MAASPAEEIELHPFRWGGPYSEMRAKRACLRDDGLCAELRVSWLDPGERIILRSSEIVGFDMGYFYDDHFPTHERNGRGKHYQHIPFKWNTEKAPEELSAECQVPGKGEFRLRLTVVEDYVDIELAIRNDTDRKMSYVDWYFCAVTFEAPSLLDRSFDRTFLFDGDGLTSLAATGEPSATMFRVAGPRGSNGFIPPLHAVHRQAAVEAQAPLIVVENRRRTHAMGLAFERAHSIFSTTGNGCYHVDPFFGHNLKPGEQRQIRGRLYLAAGRAKKLLARMQRDFPQPSE